ncbi:MAG: phosphoglycerate kinase [Patescibacteria group bacterium]|mgnify:CR=1 FL=1
MQIVSANLISSKRVILRYDMDVALGKRKVIEDFKLKAGLKTLDLCLEHAESVIMMGHVGRPDGKVVEDLKVAPIVDWFRNQGYLGDLESGKLKILENLRFDSRESFDWFDNTHHKFVQDKEALEFAKELASKGDVYINEAFSSYRLASSTTIIPILLPHAAGLHFAEEVRVLGGVRENPKKPFIAIMGGGAAGKDEEKFPVISLLSKNADAVLVGGKLVAEIREQNIEVPKNVLVGKLTEDGYDLASETVDAWENLIKAAKMIVWNGPLGKFEDPKNDSTKKVGKIVANSEAESIVGGGDTVSALNQAGLLDKFSFVSVGGGAMLKLLADGTLPTIEALK